MKNVLVTGARGFVGRKLTAALQDSGRWHVTGTSRQQAARDEAGFVCHRIPAISGETDWSSALKGVDAVVHTAGRSHRASEVDAAALDTYRRVNALGTVNLARQAASAGVERFVFMSTIGVNGVLTSGIPFCETDSPAPRTLYGMSKAEAEEGLWKVHAETGMEITIVRAPLIFDVGAPGNLARLEKLVTSGVPIPLSGIKNRRSVIHRENIVDVLKLCLSHPAAANELFVVSDGKDITTTDMVRQLARDRKVPLRLIPMSAHAFRTLLRLVGNHQLIAQLFGDLQVDSNKIQDMLEWTPRQLFELEK